MPDCRRPGCEEETRGRGEHVDAYGAKFCSPGCELKYEHVRDDARDARRAAEAEAQEEA